MFRQGKAKCVTPHVPKTSTKEQKKGRSKFRAKYGPNQPSSAVSNLALQPQQIEKQLYDREKRKQNELDKRSFKIKEPSFTKKPNKIGRNEMTEFCYQSFNE